MNKTIKLIQLMGLNPPHTADTSSLMKLEKRDVYSLYLHAKINKMAYTFLKTIEYTGYIDHYPLLKTELMRQEKTYFMFINSLRITHRVLGKLNVDHIYIKTIHEFPVLPSDIDVLIRNKISKDMIYKLESERMIPFDKGPHFVSVYNTHIDSHIPRDKKNYDVDVYDEISLSYLVYFDKEYIFKKYNEDTSFGVKVPLPECELLIHLNHSIFEQLFTLFHLYTFVSLISRINIDKLEELSNVTRSKTALFLASAIAFNILKRVSISIDRTDLIGIFVDQQNKSPMVMELPYRFRLDHITKALLEKAENVRYLTSMLGFARALTNLKELNHIISQLVIRRKRITY